MIDSSNLCESWREISKYCEYVCSRSFIKTVWRNTTENFEFKPKYGLISRKTIVIFNKQFTPLLFKIARSEIALDNRTNDTFII